MDFKDLLNLAKDNQSFAQKKFKRDKLEKNQNSKTSLVSSSAIQTFMAKKKKMEEERKATEEAERRRRIAARLDPSMGNKKGPRQTKDVSNGKETMGSTKPGGTSKVTKGIPQQRADGSASKCSKGGPNAQDKRIMADRGQRPMNGFHIPRKGAMQKGTAGVAPSTNSAPSASAKSDHSLSSETSGKPTIKQHRRRKGTESNFEWSGSVPKDNAGKSLGKAGGALSFTELMSVAKKQKDMPKNLKKPSEQAAGNQQPGQGSSSVGVDKKLKQVARNDAGNVKVERRKAKLDQQAEIECNARVRKPNQGKVFTQTIDIKSNYPQYMGAIKGATGSQPLRKGPAQSGRPGVGDKRRKILSIDEELEIERRELERKRNLLRKKMQGGLPQSDDYDNDYDNDYDDYDDDMDDFIDDGEETADYSKHIRSIFGYDRRRYADDDDDLHDMESNYRQISAEEARSSRIGKLEDEIEKRKQVMEETAGKRKRR